MLPTFIVIGAMKSGTTSLYHYLRSHPQVGMSTVKETDFFIEQNNYDRGTGWYRSLFEGGHRAAGEVSPNYTKRHIFAGVPARMKALVPGAKLIYLLRDPVERAASQYAGTYALGREPRSPAQLLAELPDTDYVQTSRYAFQLDAYLEHFAREDILIETSRALRYDRRQALRRMYRFIGVDASAGDAAAEAKMLNRRSSTRGQLPSWLRTATDRLLPQRLKDRLRPHLPAWLAPRPPRERPELPASFRRRLAGCLREDTRRLRAHTGRAFPHWRC